MKKLILAFVGLALLASCSVKSNEEKARKLIEPQIKASLIKPESYEFAKLQLDSCFSNSSLRPDAFNLMFELSELYNEYKNHLLEAEMAESNMTIYAPSYGYQSEHDKLQQKKYKADMEKAQRRASAAKEKLLYTFKDNMDLFMSLQSPDREFIGWAAIIDYRVETAGGLKTMSESLFFLNKDLTEITYSISEEKLRSTNPDDIQDIMYEFEEELKELLSAE